MTSAPWKAGQAAAPGPALPDDSRWGKADDSATNGWCPLARMIIHEMSTIFCVLQMDVNDLT